MHIFRQDKLTHMMVLADSHGHSFRRAVDLGLFPSRSVSVCANHDTTAAGLRNPNSFSRGLYQFRTVIKFMERSDILAIQVGEVDCGHLIWRRVEKGWTLDEALAASLAGYQGFLDELHGMGFHKIILTGAILPLLSDDQIADGDEARRTVLVSQRDRTDLTLRYNAALRDIAHERGLRYVDITDDLTDPATGMADPAYRHPHPGDHHLELERGAYCWAMALAAALVDYDLQARPAPTLLHQPG
ncbi:MAG: SGNH/GDSL hydrolase family protein [Azospirillaceae bacterium]|nr:SGNH/GDSL hydrolase family protein [Azospirillaceae bacterium]